MWYMRVIARGLTAMVLAFALTPAWARPCDDDNPRCSPASEQITPMKLEEFMQADEPAATSKRVSYRKKKRVTRAARGEKTAPRPPQPTAVAKRSEPARPAAQPVQQPPAPNPIDEAASSQTNDAEAAEPAQVVGANELNEIDLAAPAAPTAPAASVSDTTVGQSPAAEPEPDDDSWIGGLLLTVAGLLFLAAAGLLLLPSRLLARRTSWAVFKSSR
jgi:hypothetical protein